MYTFIKNYLVSFKVTPLRYNTLMLTFFPILDTHFNPRNTSEMRFCDIANSSCNYFSSIVEKRFLFISVFSFGNRKKSAGPKSGDKAITVLFLVKTHAQRSMVPYHCAKCKISFSTILRASDSRCITSR